MRITILFVVAYLFISTFCFSDTINVPADQPTIQAGIDAAVSGDIVLVAPGTYVENIIFNGKAITVKSRDGAKSTIIDGGNPPNPYECSVVTFRNNSVLNGFTLTNGGGNFYGKFTPGGIEGSYAGGGVCCAGSPTIKNNIIIGNSVGSSLKINRDDWISGEGGGIYIEDGSPKITNNAISDNAVLCNELTGHSEGGGIYCLNSSPEIINNTIINNTVAGIGSIKVGGGIACKGASPVISNTILWDNIGTNGPEVYLVPVKSNLFSGISIEADPLF